MSSPQSPYRVSDSVPCPRCSTSLPAGSQREPQACDRGCGEWLSLAAVDAHLCPEALEIRGAWWKAAPNGPPCAACGQAMESIATSTTAFHRCPEHGLWFDKGERDHLNHQLLDKIQQHRKLRALVELLRGGDEAKLRAFARRFLDLEAQVAALRREVRGR